MGKRGPKAKPTALKMVQGGRNINFNEPQPPKVKSPAEKPPFKLSKGGKKVWKRVTSFLIDTNVLTSADLHAIARYCDHCSQWQNLHIELRDAPDGDFELMESTTGSNYWAKKPDAIRRDRLEDMILKIEREFGLTPSARGGVNAGGGSKDKDALRNRLYGNRGAT